MLTNVTKREPNLIPLYRLNRYEDFEQLLTNVDLKLNDTDENTFIDGTTLNFLLGEYPNRLYINYGDEPQKAFVSDINYFWELRKSQYTAAVLAYNSDYDPINNYDLHETFNEFGDESRDETATKTNTGTVTDSGSHNIANTGTQTTVDSGTQTTADTGTQTTSNTGTVTDAGSSETITLNEVSAFDSNVFVNHDQSTVTGESGNTRTDNLQAQRTDNLQSQRTDNLQSQRTDNLSESGSNSNTRTDNLTENNTLGVDAEHSVQHTLRRYGNIGVTTTQQMIESELDLRSIHSLQERFVFEFCAAFTI